MRDIDLMALLLGPWPRQIARFVFESSDLRSVLLFYSQTRCSIWHGAGCRRRARHRCLEGSAPVRRPSPFLRQAGAKEVGQGDVARAQPPESRVGFRPYPGLGPTPGHLAGHLCWLLHLPCSTRRMPECPQGPSGRCQPAQTES